jgi:putative ABC transport system ATP-binding protein
VPDRFLAVENTWVSFGDGDAQVRALRGVSANFMRGTLSLIMGPSGSGKTTLLSLLGCLLSPNEGRVFIDNVPIGQASDEERTTLRRAKIGFVFQAFRLLHSLSALDNAAIGLEIRGVSRETSRAKARELLQQLNLGEKLHHEPDGLSPGEKQRVAIARALAGNPPILLADEPTASLDSTAGKNVCQILRNEAKQMERAVVVVSHDPRWQEYADRTLVLSDGELREAHGSGAR